MIPRQIHYCWFGNGPKNELFYKCYDSWKKYCPDYEIIEWNESNYDVTKNTYMYQAYQAKRWGFVTDYARLDIVYEYGGIYLDTDVELVRPLDELLELKGYVGFQKKYEKETGDYHVNTGQGFGAEAGNYVVECMLEIYDGISFLDNGKQNLTPCPLYNSMGVKQAGFQLENYYQCIDGFAIFPDNAFCPITNRDKKIKIYSETYSVHHFSTSWLTDEEKKKRSREARLDYIRYIPNRVLIKLFGKEKYGNIKRRIKR